MSEQRRAPRPVNLFEAKALIDYVKGLTLTNIKYGCVRAKELDDKRGSKKNTSYLLAMHQLSNAIRSELGLKPAPVKGKASKSDDKLASKVKELNAAIVAFGDELAECKTELKETEEALELAMDSVESTEAKMTALNEANQALTKANESLIEENKKPVAKTAAKKVTKKATKKETK